jgi:hypothetical protein
MDAMPPLTPHARLILDRMEPDRSYEPQDLRDWLPDAGIHHLREVMHELWIHRQVERAGASGWRRHRSAPPHAVPAASREVKIVKPEDLFDHDAFADFFK